MDGYEHIATLLKALGHPVRLRILQVLREGEACVCHLEAVLGQRQAYISQHLMKLRGDGLVVARREGMNVFYALADDAIAGLLDVAQETAIQIARTGGKHLPPMPTRSIAVACTCPKCQPGSADARLVYNS